MTEIRTGQTWENKLSGGRMVVAGPVHPTAVWTKDAAGGGAVHVMSHELLRTDWQLVHDGSVQMAEPSDDENYLRWWVNPDDPLAAATTEKAAGRAVLGELDRLRAATLELLAAIHEHGVPGGRVWNAYWNAAHELGDPAGKL